MKWKYIEPGPNMKPVERTYTEDEIIAEYWDFWSALVRKKGGEPTREDCIADWVVGNWAQKVDDK